MTISSALAELRLKKRWIERAIRDLEELQRLEKRAAPEPEARTARRTSSSKVIELHRRSKPQ
jgi:hypothetical protein